jgi:hypothetical protein
VEYVVLASMFLIVTIFGVLIYNYLKSSAMPPPKRVVLTGYSNTIHECIKCFRKRKHLLKMAVDDPSMTPEEMVSLIEEIKEIEIIEVSLRNILRAHRNSPIKVRGVIKSVKTL